MTLSRTPAIVIFILIALIATAITASRLRPSNDIAIMLPVGDEVVRDYYFVADQFKTLESLYIDIDIGTSTDEDLEALLLVADRLYEQLAETDYFERILYKTTGEDLAGFADTLRSTRPAFLTNDDLAALEEKTAPEEIPRHIARAKRAILGAAGAFEQDRVQEDPFDITSLATDQFSNLGKQGQGAEIVDGAIVSNDHRHVLIFAVPSFPPSNTARSEELIAFLDRARSALTAEENPNVQIRFAGGHFAHLDNATVIERDMKRTVTAMLLGVLVITFGFFRRRLAPILVLAPAAFGMTCSLAVYSLFDPSVANVVVGCSALMIGIAVDYGIHVLYHLDSQEADADAGMRAMAFPLLTGATTTIAAFLSLQFSSIAGQRQMGLLAAMGILGSVLFVFVLLPKLVPTAPPQRRTLPLPRFVQSLLSWQDRHAKAILLSILLAAIVSLFGIRNLEFDGDFRALSYLTPAHDEDDVQLRSVWQPFTPSSVVITADTLEDALAQNDRLDRFMADLQSKDVIQDYVSVADILPSQNTQQQRWDRWDAFWSDDRLANVQRDTNAAASAQGFSAGAFQPFFDSLRQEHSLLQLDSFQDTAIDTLVQSRIVSSDSESLVQTSFFTPDLDAFLDARAKITDAFPNAIVMNGYWFTEHTRTLVSREFLRLAVVASIVVVICLLCALGSLELVFAVLFPVLLSLVLTLGLLGFLGIPINLISSLFIIFVLGVGVDFSIFLFHASLSAYRGHESHPGSVGGSVFLCALTTLFGFASLTLAEHPALYSMGITGFIGINACLLASFAVAPLSAKFLFPENARYGILTFKTFIRAIWTIVDLIGRTIIYRLVLKPVQLLRHANDLPARQRFARAYLRWLMQTHIGNYPYRHDAKHFLNAEAAQFESPAIMVSNHQSLADAAFLLMLPGEFVMVVKKWVIHMPFGGVLLRDAGYICTAEADFEELVNRCRTSLDQGVSVLFFPEGSRSKNDRTRRFHKGAFELAAQTGYDILPIRLTNTRSCIRPSGFLVDALSFVLHVLPRITQENFDYTQDARALAQHTREQIESFAKADWELAQQDPKFSHRLATRYRYQGPRARFQARRILRTDPLTRGINPLIPKDARVLDLGCGIGALAIRLAWSSLERAVLGIDDRPALLASARMASQDRPNVQFEIASPWDPPNEPVDTVLLIDTLHRGSKEDQQRLAKALPRLLRSGGTIIFRNTGDEAYYRALFSESGLAIKSEHPELCGPQQMVWVLEKALP